MTVPDTDLAALLRDVAAWAERAVPAADDRAALARTLGLLRDGASERAAAIVDAAIVEEGERGDLAAVRGHYVAVESASYARVVLQRVAAQIRARGTEGT